MKRPIKFRAQNERGRFVYGDYFSQYKDGVTTHYIVEHPHGRDAGREVMWKIDVETLGEFTGLKDKNGKDIYEGDIVEIQHPAWIERCKVIFDRGSFTLHQLRAIDGKTSLVRMSAVELWDDGYWKLEIIGDIYTTPNLLTNGDK